MADPQAELARHSPTQDLTGARVGRFVIRSRLGVGGMGEVYRADDTTLKRPVALKCIAPELRADPRYRERFLKEAERASALNHQHVAGIYDVLEEKGELYLVMEYVEGVTLRERLRESVRLEQFLEIAIQSADALAAAHEKGIVHGDIKPGNIMLSSAGQVKILDFGVAKRLSPSEQSGTTVTSATGGAGSPSGTPAYMAPEVLLGRESDGRADIFSLGVVFYEALTGRHPFQGVTFTATADRILHEAPPPVTQTNPRVPEELARIVGKMLAKDPAERYSTARDLQVDLRAVQRGAAYAGLLPTPPPRPEIRPRLPRRPWAALSAAALVLVALALISLFNRPLRRWLAVGVLPAEKYLAVLPFEVTGGDQESTAFGDGLTEAITAKLTQLTATHSLQVAPASDARRLRGGSVEQAGRELGVNLAVTGSLRRWGDTVRVTVSLVDVRGRRQLRADTVDADWRDPRALEDRVVAAVLDLLEVELHPPERLALATRGTPLAGAYESYLQGRGYLQNYDKPENVESAIRSFHHALKLDPDYALAHAGLGEAYLKKYDDSKETQWVEAARGACQQALTLDPKLAPAHICLGTLHSRTGEYEGATVEFQRALESEPTSDEAYRGLAHAYERLGKPSEAERTYRRAIDLRPHYWAGFSWLGAFYFGQARYPEAVQTFQKVIELTPDNVRGYYNLGATYVFQGRYSEAIPILQRSIAIRPSAAAYNNLGSAFLYLRRFAEAARMYEEATKLDARDYVMWGNLGDACYWSQGKRAEAGAAYRRAISLAQEKLRVNPRDTSALASLARYHARFGERETAMNYLQRALALASGDADLRFKAAVVYHQFGDVPEALAWLDKALAAGLSVARVRDNPSFHDLRTDQRFQELLRKHAPSR